MPLDIQETLVMKFLLKLFLLFFIVFFTSHSSNAQVVDPLSDPPMDSSSIEDEKLDEFKSSDQLIAEADFLLDDQRLLDGRTKLLRALKKDPKNYRAHMILSGYYLVHVGHFRLALRYVREAESLFIEKNGYPPYTDQRARLEHAQILYLISQARLNLDDYPGALVPLDEFEQLHYSAQWYPGTRAWVLMKLERIAEAIQIARAGVLAGAEPGRTLNMLGILLSMHNEREESLSVFRDAIAWEFSQGSSGQPATPLNNVGEVYKELFMDEKAESSWLRATGLPDGCEHVLPTLNLALLYYDQMNLEGAKKAFDNFESCIAQYPLRNGEEHKALVAFGRGRIALLSGHPDVALTLFEEANKDRQWFGKIGTSEDDLKAAVFQSLADAHYAASNRTAFSLNDNWIDSINTLQESLTHKILGWWYERKARRLLAETLNNFEDLSTRNTDSLLEYPTLGLISRGYATQSLRRKIKKEQETDKRIAANNFYEAYLGENEIYHGNTSLGLKRVQNALTKARDHFDDLLKAHLLAVILKELPTNSDSYFELSQQLFELNRVILRNRGLLLPVAVSGSLSNEELKLLQSAGLMLSTKPNTLVSVTFSRESGVIRAEVKAPQTAGGVMHLRSENFINLINRLNENLFAMDISG